MCYGEIYGNIAHEVFTTCPQQRGYEVYAFKFVLSRYYVRNFLNFVGNIAPARQNVKQQKNNNQKLSPQICLIENFPALS